MKINLIAPIDIRYSYRGTEWHIYEYAKCLKEHSFDTTILITNSTREYKTLPNYKRLIAPYNSIPMINVECKEYLLPLKWHLFVYDNLPKNGTIYFPYSIYDYIINIALKPPGQRYIIGCHGMHLKKGHLLEKYTNFEKVLNLSIRTVLSLKKSELRNIYFHAINKEQAAYVEKEFGIKKTNIFYVPPMLDTNAYHTGENNSRKLQVLHMGGADKDLRIVLDIIDMLRVQRRLDQFEFYFIGEPDVSAENEYKNLSNVHFYGSISNKDKIKMLSRSDVIILPAYEVFPKTLLEGLSSGLYVLTSKKAACWRDITDEGIKIFVAENGYPSEYLKPLTRLSERKKNGKEINPYKEINRERTIAAFDRENVLRRVLRMFQKIA